MKKIALVMAPLVAALAACSGIPLRNDTQETLQRYLAYAGEPVSSAGPIGRFDGWNSLGRDKLVIWGGFNDAWLLTVEPLCLNLQFATRIAITTSVGTMVQSGFDHVRFRDGFRTERCRIIEIRPVDYRRMREEARSNPK